MRALLLASTQGSRRFKLRGDNRASCFSKGLKRTFSICLPVGLLFTRDSVEYISEIKVEAGRCQIMNLQKWLSPFLKLWSHSSSRLRAYSPLPSRSIMFALSIVSLHLKILGNICEVLRSHRKEYLQKCYYFSIFVMV